MPAGSRDAFFPMMSYHEIFGFMNPALSQEILEWSYTGEKPLYKATLKAVADFKKLRPSFYEQRPRKARHEDMIAFLSRGSMEEAAAALVRGWLIKTQAGMLGDFLDACGIPHKEGIAESFPDSIEDAKLNGAIEALLAKYPQHSVLVYLHAFSSMNDGAWKNLEAAFDRDSRLQFS